jgi:peptidoglycan-associated lipoprotein
MEFRPTILALTVLLIGCGSAATAHRSTMAGGWRGTLSRVNDVGLSRCRVSPVYFSFDSSDLDVRARDTLERDAHCLTQRNTAARITGMTDPRGTEEYNLALGDQRARMVTQFMRNLGVDDGELTYNSLGEEAAIGDDEHGWAHDRRAEIQPY